MKIDAVVMRHPIPGAPKHLQEFIDAIIINAGDGAHEHPTQAILDMVSLHEKFNRLKGLKIGIVGDIAHSRVALSNIYGLTTMGAKVMLCGPPNLIPKHMVDLNVDSSSNIDEIIEWADALIILRIQKRKNGSYFSTIKREYRATFGITKERMEKHKREIVIMHPGPIIEVSKLMGSLLIAIKL